MTWKLPAISGSLEPYLAPLRDLYDFAIESQIVYHAPLKSAPIQTETGEWMVTKEHMKTFVNNEQWTLGKSYLMVLWHLHNHLT